jgi:NIPSNAP
MPAELDRSANQHDDGYRHVEDTMDLHVADRQVVELRQYLLHHDLRDELIDLFDRELVETQEDTGMSVIGQFRDPDRPDYFVWLRGFPDMAARHASLTAFYDGPVWAANRQAANATMIDSDNVLVLRPTSLLHRLPVRDPSTRNRRVPVGALVVVIEHHHPEDHKAALTRFQRELIPALELTGARTIGMYETEPAPNTFDRLPVRPDNVLTWFGAFDTAHPLHDRWPSIRTIATRHGRHPKPTEVHRLTPTSRSLLDGNP